MRNMTGLDAEQIKEEQTEAIQIAVETLRQKMTHDGWLIAKSVIESAIEKLVDMQNAEKWTRDVVDQLAIRRAAGNLSIEINAANDQLLGPLYGPVAEKRRMDEARARLLREAVAKMTELKAAVERLKTDYSYYGIDSARRTLGDAKRFMQAPHSDVDSELSGRFAQLQQAITDLEERLQLFSPFFAAA